MAKETPIASDVTYGVGSGTSILLQTSSLKQEQAKENEDEIFIGSCFMSALDPHESNFTVLIVFSSLTFGQLDRLPAILLTSACH
jgi:hypothetical protein